MDESKYLELRELVREHASRSTTDQTLLFKFVNALEAQVNQVAGREQKVCTAGRMQGTNFVEREYNVSGSMVGFTLRIQFHHANKSPLLHADVFFIAEATAMAIKVTCKNTHEWVDQPRDVALTDAGLLAVIALLDKAVTEEVEHTLDSLGLN